LQVQDPAGAIMQGDTATMAAAIHIFARTIDTTKGDSCRSLQILGLRNFDETEDCASEEPGDYGSEEPGALSRRFSTQLAHPYIL